MINKLGIRICWRCGDRLDNPRTNAQACADCMQLLKNICPDPYEERVFGCCSRCGRNSTMYGVFDGESNEYVEDMCRQCARHTITRPRYLEHGLREELEEKGCQ